MTPAAVSLCWAPGERLLGSAGAAPSDNIEAIQSLPRPFLNLFFAGHSIFTNNELTIIEKSQRYRAIIIDCRRMLSSTATTITGSLEEQLNALSKAHAVWHFIEALYLTNDAIDDHHISAYLAEWFLLNYKDKSAKAETIAQKLKSEGPHDDDNELWGFLIKLAIVGDLNGVEQFLSVGIKEEDIEEKWPFGAPGVEHKMASDEPFGTTPIVTTIRRLMESAPGHTISTRGNGSWDEWKATCGLWADAKELENHEGAKRLLGLFSGKLGKIEQVCSTWEEMLVACSFYAQFSNVTGGNMRGGIGHVSNCCAAATAAFRAPEDVAGGALVESALGNVSNAVVRVAAGMPTSWFPAHLCDLLMSAGLLEDIPAIGWGSSNRPMGMREFYMKEFARGLERYPGLWRVAVDYYAACPAHGTSLLIDLLPRVPFEGPSDPKVEKVLFICAKRNLPRTASNVCEKIGADCLSQGNLGGAMSWFARGGIFTRAVGAAETALINAEKEGANSEAARALECVVRAVTNIGDERMRQMFEYMRDYCKLQRALADVAEARKICQVRHHRREKPTSIEEIGVDLVSAACRLVGGGGLPRRFWVVVAYEVAQVIALHPTVSKVNPKISISELLSALQLASGPHRSHDMIEGLQARLAYEKNSSGQAAPNAEPSRLREAEEALNHCRSVLIRALAEKINAE
eukprot:GFKZ01010889.1.p1 GENE.GFKZ01010889.1~~GFKZ01010889.1.p1  ORF type:complete len:687 (-),score=81.82 GFKZ01010889.1:672-2732(-)